MGSARGVGPVRPGRRPGPEGARPCGPAGRAGRGRKQSGRRRPWRRARAIPSGGKGGATPAGGYAITAWRPAGAAGLDTSADGVGGLGWWCWRGAGVWAGFRRAGAGREGLAGPGSFARRAPLARERDRREAGWARIGRTGRASQARAERGEAGPIAGGSAGGRPVGRERDAAGGRVRQRARGRAGRMAGGRSGGQAGARRSASRACAWVGGSEPRSDPGKATHLLPPGPVSTYPARPRLDPHQPPHPTPPGPFRPRSRPGQAAHTSLPGPALGTRCAEPNARRSTCESPNPLRLRPRHPARFIGEYIRPSPRRANTHDNRLSYAGHQ